MIQYVLTILLLYASKAIAQPCVNCRPVYLHTNQQTITYLTITRADGTNTPLYLLSEDNRPIFTIIPGKRYAIHGLQPTKVYSYTLSEDASDSSTNGRHEIFFIGGQDNNIVIEDKDKVHINFGIDISKIKRDGEFFTQDGNPSSRTEFIQSLQNNTDFPDKSLPYVTLFLPHDFQLSNDVIRQLRKICHLYITVCSDSVMTRRLQVDSNKCMTEGGCVVVQKREPNTDNGYYKTSYYYGRQYLSAEQITRILQNSESSQTSTTTTLLVLGILAIILLLTRDRYHGIQHRTTPQFQP